MSQNDAVHPNIAADRLGIPVDAVYDRIRRGELAAQRCGDRWVVMLPPISTYDLSPNDLQEQRAAALESVEDRIESTLTRQLAERDAVIEEIRSRLASLESESRHAMAASEVPVAQSTPARQTMSLTGKHMPDIRLSDVRPRLLARTGILGLIVSGIVVQSSSAQRSDDLMIAFVFACGAVTGAIASWLALIR